jgi:feruloyl esterase
MLTRLIDWVEKDEAPRSVEASGKAFPNRTRPLCPYPSHAQYKGEGSADSAASFECRNN